MKEETALTQVTTEPARKFDLNTALHSPRYEETLNAILARNAILLEEHGTRVREQYGADLNDREVLQVLKIEEERRQCDKCVGLPCQKIKNQNFVPYAWYDERLTYLCVTQTLCKYEKMRREQIRMNAQLKGAKIPAEYLGKTFDDYQVDEKNARAVKLMKKLLDKPEYGAYLYGHVGAGKTYLAAIFAQECIKRGRAVTFATLPNISMAIRSSFNAKSGYVESEILENLYKVPTLIVDDVGMEKPTRFVCTTLSNLFNERYNARVQTIMTSNFDLSQMEENFNNPTDSTVKTIDGTRIVDRCKQMCIPVELKGGSRR